MKRRLKRPGRFTAARNSDNYSQADVPDLFEDGAEADKPIAGTVYDPDDEQFDDEQFDDGLDEPQAYRVSSREVAAMRTKRRRRSLVIIGACVAGALVLGLLSYMGITLISENNRVQTVTTQISALSDTSAYASLSDYSVATAQARAAYNALSEKLRDKVDIAPLTAAEDTITRLTPVQDALNALPTEITFENIAEQTALITAARTEYDALSEADKQLLDESPLTGAEALKAAAQAEFAPILDLNARIAAFTISDEATAANIEQATATLAAFRTEITNATFDTSHVDTGRLDMLDAQLAELVSSYSTRLSADGPAIIAKLTDASDKLNRIVKLIKAVTIAEGNTVAVEFPLSNIVSYANEYETLMKDVIALIKSADMFNVIPGYTDAALNSAQRGIDKANAGVKYGNSTSILDTASQSEFLAYFTSAVRYTSEVSVAVSTVNSELATYLEGLDAADTASAPDTASDTDAAPGA